MLDDPLGDEELTVPAILRLNALTISITDIPSTGLDIVSLVATSV